MSMPVISLPTNPVDREQAISDIIESVALEETGISHILNAEGEKIQKILAVTNSVEEILAVNKSVVEMVSAITKLETVLQSKLEIFKDCTCNVQ